MGSKKTETKPWGPQEEAILGAQRSAQSVFSHNQPRAQQESSNLFDAFDAIKGTAFGTTPFVQAGQQYAWNNLNGDYLNRNPYVDKMISDTAGDVTDRVGAQFSRAGMFGSTANQGTLARELARAENEARFGTYEAERGRQQQAASMVPSLRAADYAGVNPALDVFTTAIKAPYEGVNALTGNISTLSRPYSQTRQSDGGLGLLSTLLSAGGQAGAAALSDERVKNVHRKVGTRPDGLGLYEYDMKDDPSHTPQVGVLAQEVEAKRPDAVGPTTPGGIKTVNYGLLGMPGPVRADTLGGELEPMRVNVPRIDRPGFGGFVDRLIDPNFDTTAGKVGMFFRKFGEAAGDPFSLALSGMNADEASRRKQAGVDAADAEDRLLKREGFELKRREAAYPKVEKIGDELVSITPGETPTVNPLYRPQPGPTQQQQNYEYMMRQPDAQRPAFRSMLSGYNQTPDGIAAAAARAGATAEAQGQARAKYRAPPRPRATPPKYAVGPGGKLMKWVD